MTNKNRTVMGLQKIYVILGYDKDTDELVGVTDRGDFTYFKTCAYTLDNYPFIKTDYKTMSMTEIYKWTDLNSPNQWLWNFVRQKARDYTKIYKKKNPGSDVVFKPYRINSKRCPVYFPFLRRFVYYLKNKEENIPKKRHTNFVNHCINLEFRRKHKNIL